MELRSWSYQLGNCTVVDKIIVFQMILKVFKQAEKLKSCKMKEGWMKNDECWSMNDEDWWFQVV